MVVCEYCDARVEIVRRNAPRPVQQPSSSSLYSAMPHYSGLVWVFFIVPLITFAGVAIAFVSSMPWGWLEQIETITKAVPPIVDPDPGDRVEAVEAVEAVQSVDPGGGTPETKAPGGTSAAQDASGTGNGSDEPDAPEPPDDDPDPKPVRRSVAPAKPTGPVISVDEARKQIEPKVLACMKQTGTHHILAYMGNKKVGPVKVLSDPRTRVDGLRVALARTKLGRCINEAGRSVRTRAFRSNYVRLQLRNEAVPDPLADLPARADRKAIEAAITALDPKVHACARKHGEEGAREVFYFRIDGPTGKVMSARGSYGSRAFRRCSEAVYRGMTFPKVQQHLVKYTHDLQL